LQQCKKAQETFGLSQRSSYIYLVMNKTKDLLPELPFECYRYLDDNTLVKGIVKAIHFFEEENSLLGIPHIEYDEKGCRRSLTPEEYCSAPYAVDLNLTIDEARSSRLQNLQRTLELYKASKERCIQNFLTEYEEIILKMRKTKQQISELV
jgi:hypothetical protein